VGGSEGDESPDFPKCEFCGESIDDPAAHVCKRAETCSVCDFSGEPAALVAHIAATGHAPKAPNEGVAATLKVEEGKPTTVSSRLVAAAQQLDRRNPPSDAELARFYEKQVMNFTGERVVANSNRWCPPVGGVGPNLISSWLGIYGASNHGVALHAIRVAVMQQTYNLTKALEATAPNADDPFSPQNPLNPATASRIVSMRQPGRQQQAAQFPPCEPEVIVADCVDVARHLIDNGLNPLLLNMASATSPGGGFLKGDGAQEENLHRRSNYYLATNSLEPHPRSFVRYPLPDDGGIYSPSITFFRGTEEQGYPICEPVSIACIAVAALRHPNVSSRNGELVFASDSNRALMKQKVRLMFRAAAENGHDALVLGAFGCGAFKCPAEAVARLMGEVNQEYRSVFRRVVIAIYDDHNSFNAVNVNGLVLPFCRALGTDPKYLTSNGPCALGGMCNVPGCSRTHPVQCRAGAGCSNLNPHHLKSFAHPPMCVEGGLCAKVGDRSHTSSYRHPPQCLEGGECPNLSNRAHQIQFSHPGPCRDGNRCQFLFATTQDAAGHRRNFVHPLRCRNGGLCKAMDTCEFVHPPSCPGGGLCPNRADKDHAFANVHPKLCTNPDGDPRCLELSHLMKFSHSLQPCRHGGKCSEIQSTNHCMRFSHAPTLFPCSAGILCRETKNADHMSKFSHPCWFHNMCRTQTDEDHARKYYHLHMPQCKYGEKCELLSDMTHRMEYAHPTSTVPCRYAEFCNDFSKDHRAKYLHPAEANGDCCDIRGFNCDVNFYENHQWLLRNLNDAGAGGGGGKTFRVDQEARSRMQSYLPCHRVKPATFESIIQHGNLVSKVFQDGLKEDPVRAALTELSGAPMVKVALNRNRLTFSQVRNFAKAVLDRDSDGREKEKKKLLAQGVESADLHRLEECAKRLRKTIEGHTFTGIGYQKDVEAGTNKHVFAIIGPHTGKYYGNIVLVLDRSIMYHPDFYATPTAVTTFLSGNQRKGPMPWLCKDAAPGTPGSDLMDVLPKCKVHPAVGGWDLCLAGHQQLAAKQSGKSFDNHWLSVDSHCVVEGHLPETVPLTLVRMVVMPKAEFDSLSADCQSTTKRMFGSALKLVDSDLEVERVARSAFSARVALPKGFCFHLPPTRRRHRLLPLVVNCDAGFRIRCSTTGGPWAIHIGQRDGSNRFIEKGVSIIINTTDPNAQRRSCLLQGNGSTVETRTPYLALGSGGGKISHDITFEEPNFSKVKVRIRSEDANGNHDEHHMTISLSKLDWVKKGGSYGTWNVAVGTDHLPVRFEDLYVCGLH
jgi:uncharacterized protein (TIGR02452 family)